MFGVTPRLLVLVYNNMSNSPALAIQIKNDQNGKRIKYEPMTREILP